jgi:hypothetical protein
MNRLFSRIGLILTHLGGATAGVQAGLFAAAQKQEAELGLSIKIAS